MHRQSLPNHYLGLSFHRFTNRWLGLVVSIAAGLLIASSAFAAQPVLLLDDERSTLQAWPSVWLLVDAGKKLTIQNILSERPEFIAPSTAYGTLGLRKEAIWLHIPVTVHGTSNGLWVLDINYPVLNSVDMYIVAGDKIVNQAHGGNLVPRGKKPIDSRSITFALKLEPGMNYDLYLRVENLGAMILPITLAKPVAFMSDALDEQMLQGLLTGLALCLLFYSLAQWISLGEHLFVKYAILITGSLLFSLLQFGIGAQYIWPDNAWMELHVGGLSALIAAAGSFLFVEHALRGPHMKPWLRRVMWAGACLMTLFAICFALGWLNIQQVTAIVSTLGLAPVLLGLPGAIHRARRGDQVGWYFLLAWTVYFVTTFIMIQVIKGKIGVNFWSLHSFQFGATLDMLIFMRVLGLQTKALQLAAHQVRLERDSLHSMAHTDPLTGLPNRRILNSAISTAIANGRPDEILAVFMLDLDGFKQVNDQFGHDIGDELLIAVANRLRANLRSSDVISRMGGDEFLVLSGGLKVASQAQELGEKLVKAMGEPFILAKHTWQVGLTIGYAIAPDDAVDTRALLKHADAAMYAGKQSGKHCVRHIGLVEASS